MNKKIYAAVIVLLTLVVLLAGCSSPSSTSTSTSTSKTTNATVQSSSTITTAASQSTPKTTGTLSNYVINISNFKFAPDTMTVPVGSTVSWVNKDSISHSVAADSGSFKSGDLATGDIYNYTFKTAGSFAYHCAGHPFMMAKIIVQ